MGIKIAQTKRYGPALRTAAAGLKAVLDARGVPDDGGRYIDLVGGQVRLGHEHGHPGCEDYRRVFPKEQHNG